jgi:simple sugar transport system ATP-binding protein
MLELRQITKRFGDVLANDHVDITVKPGTIHAIVGENGAGKSTAMRIAYGFYTADSGEIIVDGQPRDIKSPHDAIALGIGMVHQHFMLVETMTVAENIVLGAEPGTSLALDLKSAGAQIRQLSEEFKLAVNPNEPIEHLSVGQQQRVELLKALYRHARLLILDEPTAVLTPQETEALFVTLRHLRSQGTTILLITHKLKEIMALCDAVTVMRAGAVVLDCQIAETSVDQLAEAMVGRRVTLGRDASAARAKVGEALLSAQGLRWVDAMGVVRLSDVSLTLRAGEIVGIAGVSGNGQSELLETLAGMHMPQHGKLELAGQQFVPGRWLDPARARSLGLAHVPEDRHRCGLVLPFAAWESAVLGHQGLRRFSSAWGWMKQALMRSDTAKMMEQYDVRPRNPQLRSSKFSGGNQQKLVLAREAIVAPKVLLVGQPTRGVDIGAIEFIHGRLRAMRDAGGAVLVVSSELDEILALSDRVLVMDRGRIAGELPIEECTEQALGCLMAGVALPEKT